MSIGNLKTYGNKGNNFPFQLGVLEGLQKIYDVLSGSTSSSVRTPNILNAFGPGTIPNNIYSFSIANVGTNPGTVAGQPIPAGATISYNAELNNVLTGIAYDATATTFLITWID